MDAQHKELISAFHDGELSPAEQNRVRKLLKSNPEAAAYLGSLQDVSTHVASAPKRNAPESVLSGVMDGIGAGSALAEVLRMEELPEPQEVVTNDPKPAGRVIPLHRRSWFPGAAAAAMVLLAFGLTWAWQSVVDQQRLEDNGGPELFRDIDPESSSLNNPTGRRNELTIPTRRRTTEEFRPEEAAKSGLANEDSAGGGLPAPGSRKPADDSPAENQWLGGPASGSDQGVSDSVPSPTPEPDAEVSAPPPLSAKSANDKAEFEREKPGEIVRTLQTPLIPASPYTITLSISADASRDMLAQTIRGAVVGKLSQPEADDDVPAAGELAGRADRARRAGDSGATPTEPDAPATPAAPSNEPRQQPEARPNGVTAGSSDGSNGESRGLVGGRSAPKREDQPEDAESVKGEARAVTIAVPRSKLAEVLRLLHDLSGAQKTDFAATQAVFDVLKSPEVADAKAADSGESPEERVLIVVRLTRQ